MKKNRGQLTIFFAISMLMLITILAFVVNVGLYVKAKINLQNAVDAAAWSGAAVQSRQLTSIAHLNWEMRNTYKEWMFKYYVLGQFGVPTVEDPTTNAGAQMNFRLWDNISSRATTLDKYNIPSVCIHFSGSYNVCKIYSLPGLPSFENVGLPDLDEMHNAFEDMIVEQKALSCSKRSLLNFNVTAAWAYGTKTSNQQLFEQAPSIATHRVGAWPKAVELAFRIRNLEYLVNTPPKGGLCLGGGISGCVEDVQSLEAAGIPNNERSVKAFYSAWKNLGNSFDREMKDSFVLTELAPRAYTPSDNQYHVSNLFIPSEKIYGKQYLDLRLYLLNLVSFYSLFAPMSEANSTVFPGINTEGACSVSKVGIPVPGYPFGFDKNPAVVTYYAVKGEAEFNGLFNPFRSSTKLTAYAAAKPFGGRIGPRLFHAEGESIRPRISVNRSRAYLSTLGLNTSQYEHGLPIPTNGSGTNTFWVDNTSNAAVGGAPVSGPQVVFAIPNLLYDLVGNMSVHSAGSDKVQLISEQTSGTAGLYDKQQFTAFRNNLAMGGAVIDGNAINNAIKQVRAPTRYEALNYLIPHEQPGSYDSPASTFIENGQTKLRIWAPLFLQGQNSLIYNSIGDMVAVLDELILINRTAIDTYTSSLKDVADKIKSSGTDALYDQAASVIWDGDSANGLSCASFAGYFSSFYTLNPDPGSSTRCPPALKNSLTDYWNSQIQGNSSFTTFHIEDFTPAPNSGESFLTAFLPGPRQGATEEGTLTAHPFGLSGFQPQNFRRNAYSTKLTPFEALGSNTQQGYGSSPFAVYSEGNNAKAGEDLGTPFENSLDQVGLDLNSLNR